MTDQRTLEIVMKAKDLVSKTTGKISGKMKTFGEKSKRALGVARDAAKKAAAAVKSILKPLALVTTALSALSGAALFGAIKSAADFGDEVQKMSQRLGLSTELLSELRFQAELSGTDFKAAASGYKVFARNIFDASRGMGEALVAFQELDLEFTDAQGNLRPMEDLIGDVADKFSVMEDGTKKTALSMKLFSRSGADLIPLLNSGREGLAAMAEDARRLGIVIDKEAADKAANFNDQLSTLLGAFRGLKFSIGVEFFDDMADAMREIAFWLADNKDDIVKFFSEVGEKASTFAKAIIKSFSDPTTRQALVEFFLFSFDSIFKASGEIAALAFTNAFGINVTRLIADVIREVAASLESVPFIGSRLKGLRGAADGISIATRVADSAGDSKLFGKIIEQTSKSISRFYDTFSREVNLEEAINKTKKALESPKITSGGGGGGGTPIEQGGFFKDLTDGFVAQADRMKEVFLDVSKNAGVFAADAHRAISTNFFDLAKRQFNDFKSFVKDTFRDILDSILGLISDALASQVVSGFGSLLGVVFGGGSNPLTQIPLGGGSNSPLFGPRLPDGVFDAPLGGGASGIGVNSASAGTSTTGTTIIIQATDAASFEAQLNRSDSALANALANAVSRDNSLRGTLRGAIG